MDQRFDREPHEQHQAEDEPDRSERRERRSPLREPPDAAELLAVEPARRQADGCFVEVGRPAGADGEMQSRLELLERETAQDVVPPQCSSGHLTVTRPHQTHGVHRSLVPAGIQDRLRPS